MQALLQQYLDFISLEKGLSPNTRESYGHDLQNFLDWLRKRQITSVNDINRKHLLTYLMDGKDAGLSPTTLSRRMVSVRMFFRYLQQEGLLGANITDAMDSPRLWKLLPETLSPDEVDRLLKAPPLTSATGLRDRTILELLYGCGLRVSECANLTLDQCAPANGYVRCVGKGNKERIIPFGRQAAHYLERYLDESRPSLDRAGTCTKLFVSRRGTPISRKTIWHHIRRYAVEAGIAKTVKPHMLRHSFASHMLANDAPLRVIQELLGHADIATTQIYTHIDQIRLTSIHKTYHPRA